MTTKELITKHEGKRLYAYKDSVGKLTIGVGHNLDDNGLSNAAVEFILDEDIKNAVSELVDIFEDFDTLPNGVQSVLIDMMFNMGYHRFIGFKKMISAIREHNYERAAKEAADSKWCSQVGIRCTENCAILAKGE